MGSGKTLAGCVEALRQPASTGMILAPTYPMLRDATLRTFLSIARPAIAEFNKAEMRVSLVNGTTILFRSADDPDRLRGPNLGWFWLDEAAMMPREVWLIMLGRLRESPGRAWITTTPRGRDWIYKSFKAEARPGYDLIRADSRTNTYLPAGFVDELRETYEHDFARQEIAGEFIADAFGQLIPDDWIDRLPLVKRPERMGYAYGGLDLGEGVGRDHTVFAILDEAGLIDVEGSGLITIPQAATKMVGHAERHRIRANRFAYDAGGRGKDLSKYLQPYDYQAVPYHGGARLKGGKWENKRTAMAYKLRRKLDPDWLSTVEHDPSPFAPARVEKQTPFGLPRDRGQWWPRMAEELRGLRYEVVGGRFKLEKKEDYADRLGRSPDYVDALLCAMAVGDTL